MTPDCPGAGPQRATVGVEPVDASHEALEALFLANLDTIDSLVRATCHRNGTYGADAEDFAAEVRLKLLENDYEVLRKFQRRSSIRTYLNVVIQHFHQDFRNHQWGKWRPSAAARRMGPIAERLETLLSRDGVSFDEACQQLMGNEQVPVTYESLVEIAIRLPSRTRRVLVTEEALENVCTEQPHEYVQFGEREREVRRLNAVLTAAVASLPSKDRLCLRLRFQDDVSIGDIAEILHCDARWLYRRIPIVLRQLREALEAAGFDHTEANAIITHHPLDISLALTAACAPDEAPPVVKGGAP